ncbi:Glycosyl hydrolases family 43 [Paraprevotella clara]|uniref:Glycosyl hydrolases family 43 n=1 Tax=Paraprevotella clara TaxID=454154 RepID=A0A6N2Z566_9BACT
MIFCVWGLVMVASVGAQSLERITPGQEWPDRKGEHINAHGGGLLFHEGKYYWYGENRPARGFTTEVGVEVYSSSDLMNWEDEGVALAVSEEAGHDIERGCIMERPKVIRNPKTGKFVMLFHLELKGKGYAAARVGFAESDSPVGPFRFIRSLRPNAGKWPTDFSRRDIRKAKKLKETDYKEWWTPEWREAIREGLLLARDVPGGQMSRDMTVYVDDDGKAYHIYSAEENLTLNLAELTDDYLDYTGRYVRIAPGGQNEAPTIFKRDGVYWMITSGCTGWAPNEARMFKAASLWGPWEQLPSPFVGKDAKKSFHTQGTYIFKVEGTEDGFVFMADRWNPQSLKNSRHIWLPIDFEADGTPVIRWVDSWSPKEWKSIR